MRVLRAYQRNLSSHKTPQGPPGPPSEGAGAHPKGGGGFLEGYLKEKTRPDPLAHFIPSEKHPAPSFAVATPGPF